MRSLKIAVAAVALVAAGAGNAAVQYDFTAYSSYDLSGSYFYGSFTYIAPTFIVPYAAIPAASLTSCAAYSNVGPAVCTNQEFVTGYAPNMVTVSFGVDDGNFNGGVFYYFDDFAVSTPGTYQSKLLGAEQLGQLIVTNLSGAVPEPASWAFMIAGFGLVGGALRQRRSAALTA